MAKTGEDKAKKPSGFMKFLLFFKNLGLRIWHSFRDMFAELKKVSWPTRSELINYTMIVVGFMLIMGVVILLIDSGAGALVQLIVPSAQ